MTVDEIFKKLVSHMKKGIMIHQDLEKYYDFLNLCGYKKCHQYHYLDENYNYKKLYHYYVSHFNKLIEEDVKKQNVIPTSWYQYLKSNVDIQTKRQAVELGMKIWIDWEKETKKFYQNMYAELVAQGEIAAAMFLQSYICNVSDQLKCAEKKMLDIKATNYDICFIVESQKQLHKKYKKKIKSFFNEM